MKFQSQSQADEHAVKVELAAEVLTSSGRLRLGVTGWSMLPTVWPGDTLVIERANSEAVSEGDIVLFRRDGRFFVHRVIGKITRDLAILTRGDAMTLPDPPVPDSDLMGKVVLIQRKGKRVKPGRDLSLSARTVAAAVRRSETIARVVVGVHGMLHGLLGQNSNHRAAACQN